MVNKAYFYKYNDLSEFNPLLNVTFYKATALLLGFKYLPSSTYIIASSYVYKD